ncbi:hypothetical protein MC885_015685, partial [Smutsia gigantea]
MCPVSQGQIIGSPVWERGHTADLSEDLCPWKAGTCSCFLHWTLSLASPVSPGSPHPIAPDPPALRFGGWLSSLQAPMVPLLSAVGLQDLIRLQRRERWEPTCQLSRRTPIIKNVMEVLLVGTSPGRVGTMGPFLPMPPSKQRLNLFVVTATSLSAYRDSSLRAWPLPSSLRHQSGPKQSPEELGWQRDPYSVPSIVFPCHLQSPMVCPFPALCQPLPIQGAQSIQSTNDQSLAPEHTVEGLQALGPAISGTLEASVSGPEDAVQRWLDRELWPFMSVPPPHKLPGCCQ